MLKKIGILLTISMSLLVLTQTAAARLTVHITQGVSQQMPIAVLPFSGAASQSNLAPKGIAGVIQDDLRNSGRFKVMRNGFPEKIVNARAVSWQKWPVDYMVIGKITAQGSARYKVSYQLVSRLNHQIFSAREFHNISEAQFRRLAHTISNYLYKAITGKPGYFTSKIAYIEVENPYQHRRAVYHLTVADYDGFAPHALLTQTGAPIMSPAWSNDGKSIAYVSYYKGKMVIYRIDVYSGQRKLLANYQGINSAPSFSPDDKTLAMALSQGYSENTDIYLMNLKNDKLYKKLTTGGINTAPSYSPSGNTLTFVSNRGGTPQIYSTTLNHQNLNMTRLSYDVHQAFDPQYTPNGKYLVFMAQKNTRQGTQIARLDLASGQVMLLTHGKSDASPSVSPDGYMVIYAQGDEDGNTNLAMVSIDGKVQITLPSNSKGSVQSPAWSKAG